MRRRYRYVFPALMIAEISMGLAENDMAFQWLNKAFDQKDLARSSGVTRCVFEITAWC